jgi:hypothetical protein
MEHEKRVAQALGIKSYSPGGRTQKCILRVCAAVSLDTSDEDIVKASKSLPFMLRRAIDAAKKSCDEADDGQSSSSSSDSSSESSSDEEDAVDKALEGGEKKKDSKWEATKAVQSKTNALKMQLESFYRGRVAAELNAAHSKAADIISRHSSTHSERAKNALHKEREALEARVADGWKQFHEKAEKRMEKLIPLEGGDWRSTMKNGLREARSAAINATHEYINENAPAWKSEMQSHGERALKILNSMK